MSSGFVTGHRYLYKYGWKSREIHALRDEIMDTVRFLYRSASVNTWRVGMAIGADSIFFWSVQQLIRDEEIDLRVIACPPCDPTPNPKWPSTTKELYRKALALADEVAQVDEVPGYGMEGVPSGEFHVKKLFNRNRYMADTSDWCVAIWDGRKTGGTYHAINLANEEKTVIKVEREYPLFQQGDESHYTRLTFV